MRILLMTASTVVFILGLIMIFSTTSAEVLDLDLEQDAAAGMVKQIIFACLGIVCAMGIQKIGYQTFIRYSPIFMFGISILLILVLIPGIGREVNGGRRWLGIGGFSIQPSEFVKYIVPAYLIYRYTNFRKAAIPLGEFLRWVGVTFIPIFLILVEPNNGTAAVIVVISLALISLTRVPRKFWALPLFVVMLVGGLSASQLPYVAARLKVYMNPESDIKGKGHQPLQAKIAAGSGQFLGRGPGKSLQKLSYLPEAQNDYIAAIYAEEFGFLGIAFLIGLYLVVAYAGFGIAYQCQDLKGFLFATTITFLISFQAFLNLGVVSGLLPSTGLNLPLFSQGGSSLIANIMGISLLLNISLVNEEENPETSDCFCKI